MPPSLQQLNMDLEKNYTAISHRLLFIPSILTAFSIALKCHVNDFFPGPLVRR